MSRSASDLRADAERIWRAGVAAVSPERLIPAHVRVDGDWLLVGDETIALRDVNRIAIVGAGKAAGAMAVALENVLGPQLLAEKDVIGWVNVPADCVVPTQRVHLHAARPAGVNEPRPEGVEGTRRILELVSSLGPADVCICVSTGGGSALLPAPVPEISLDDKIELTRLLSAAGANIEQINTVRRPLSLVKGGGLARACGAGRLVTLMISDVLGDLLEAIASGPTVKCFTTAADALAVLEDLRLVNEPAIRRIVGYLQQRRDSSNEFETAPFNATHLILGNNATAVDAAGAAAERLGYSHAMISAIKSLSQNRRGLAHFAESSEQNVPVPLFAHGSGIGSKPEGAAEEVGRHLAEMALRMRSEPGPDCLISGGEPTVTLVVEARRGKGGRNQQLALAALTALGACDGIAFLSGGTDGEDGPTDAAGALVTEDVVRSARLQNLDAHEYLARNDAYHFFKQVGGLFITGPTQTNVCDLRVVVVDRGSRAS